MSMLRKVGGFEEEMVEEDHIASSMKILNAMIII